MDKVVDHLLVFKGGGEIKDFPGNYTQYREWISMESSVTAAPKVKDEKKKEKSSNTARQRMTFKEKYEFVQLEKDIMMLEEEQRKLEEDLCSGTLSVEELTEKSKRLPVLKDELDEKTMRWLELSELKM